MLKTRFLAYFATFGLLLCLSGQAFSADIKNIRMWLAPDNTRLVFDLSGKVSHKLFTLTNPDRIVIDVTGAKLVTALPKVDVKGSPIKKIRAAKKDKDLRIVLDLAKAVKPKSFDLKPNDKYGHRLVVDLFNAEKPSVVKTASPQKSTDKLRDIVIAIDAGHGGEDPGAIGPGGVREKDVVLAIAKEVKRLIDQEKGFRAELVRTGDYYVSLRGRTTKARKKNADLFVSVHADAFKNAKAKGASVWVLSRRSATSEVGRWLARKENSADLIGGVGTGVSLEDKDDVLASVLLDMSMTASRSDSQQVAVNIHKNIAKFAKMHKNQVERAGFMVLKSPDIPSLLVETGFISNPGEAKLLRTSWYRKKMANAIFSGIKSHFWNKPPAYTYIAQIKNKGKVNLGQKVYRVVGGDNLSAIASRHGVSLAQLRKVNSLKSDVIRIGQVLKIP